MLKVKNEKGKFDIVLSEATLLDAEAKDIALKRRQNSKGFSTKTSKGGLTSQAKTTKKQVTAINHSKKNDRTKSVQMGQQRDINDVTRKKSPNSSKELTGTKDASYLTKDQLSRILSSLDSHDIPAGLQGSMKSEARETFVHQSLAINNQKSSNPAHASDFKTSTGITASTEQRKETEFKEYNPWGRPGGGAPIRNQSGDVVADFKKMNQNEVDAMPVQTRDVRTKMMTTGQATNAHYSSTEVPAAMRSSFAVGAPGTVMYETNQSKAEETKKWLQDLEKQIKEKKDKEAQEKLQQSLKESKHETWYQTPVPPHESSASSTLTEQHSPLQTGRAGNVHARGHGLQSLGQVNQDELERKRLKTLEHQNEVDAMPVQTRDVRPKMMTTGQDSNAHYSSTDVPAAMRSSFAVGAPGTVMYETNQSKAEETKKWLQDLEKQIKEKKDKEAQEKLQQSLKESKHETWYQTPVPPHESSASVPVPASSTLTKQHSPLQTVQASVAPVISGRAGNVHARGHGLQSLGQVNRDELERKRLKTLEHQLAIKEQVEEKRRIKQEEKERRMKDEAEKEQTLAEERTRLQNQYQEELKMRHQKEVEARRRAEALQVSVLQANQSAQQEKAAKRIKQLESGGHDVSGLRSRMETGRDSVQQDTALGQVSSSYVTEDPQSSSRIGQAGTTLPQEDGSRARSFQKNASLESELKEISLTASLESQWTPSSPVSSLGKDSHVKAHSHSSSLSRKAAGQSNTTTRSQSQKSLRKQQPPKRPIRKRTSLENVTQDLGSNPPPPPLEDAFMLPYRRTSSATFPVALDTDQDSTVNTSKPTLKKAGQAAQKKPTNIKKHNGGTKVSEITRSGISSKNTGISSKMAEKRKPVKQDKAKLTDGKPLLHPVQVSPDPLPTARQEMILQQLAALRQGLMMKERELHYGAL